MALWTNPAPAGHGPVAVMWPAMVRTQAYCQAQKGASIARLAVRLQESSRADSALAPRTGPQRLAVTELRMPSQSAKLAATSPEMAVGRRHDQRHWPTSAEKEGLSGVRAPTGSQQLRAARTMTCDVIVPLNSETIFFEGSLSGSRNRGGGSFAHSTDDQWDLAGHSGSHTYQQSQVLW